MLTLKSLLTVTLWRIPQTQRIKSIVVTPNVNNAFTFRPPTFSPDARLLALSYFEKGITKVGVFSVPNGLRVHTIVLGETRLAPLLIAGLDVCWQTKEWRLERSVSLNPFHAFDNCELPAAFSPDGSLVALGEIC